ATSGTGTPTSWTASTGWPSPIVSNLVAACARQASKPRTTSTSTTSRPTGWRGEGNPAGGLHRVAGSHSMDDGQPDLTGGSCQLSAQDLVEGALHMSKRNRIQHSPEPAVDVAPADEAAPVPEVRVIRLTDYLALRRVENASDLRSKEALYSAME